MSKIVRTEGPPPGPLKKSLTTFVVVAPLLVVLSIPFLWPWIAVPMAMVQAFFLYIATGLGITVSFHREHTHKSIRLRPGARYTMATLGLAGVEGLIKYWCAMHTMHHHHTDRCGDPHSPHLADGLLNGFIHAHFGWFYKEGKPDFEYYVPHILEDKGLMFLDRLFPYIAVASFVVPGFLVLPFEPSWQGFFAGVFWGGFVRIFAMHHITWSINSVTHLWGTRPFRSQPGDMSTNNFIFGILGFGEGWHRNHHAFQKSARIGLRWWEFDLGWILIKVLDFFGQVEYIHVPTPEQIRAKEITT